MKRERFTYLLTFLLSYLIGTAQTFHGFGSSKYAGAQNVIFNPALIGSSPNKIDVHIVSFHTALGSDYTYFTFKDGLGFRDGFKFGESANDPKDDNHFYRTVDFLGPSVMYRINRNHSVGINTRLRGIFNVNNFDGRLFENVNDGFFRSDDFTTQINDFSTTIHVWGEVGLSYGYTLDHVNYSLTVGTTVKRLEGVGSVYAYSEDIEATFNLQDRTLSTEGELTFGETRDFSTNDFELKSTSNGLGVDVGIAFETEFIDFLNGNSFRMGLSVHDIGSLKYEGATSEVYDLDDTVDATTFEENDIKVAMDKNYTGVVEIGDQRINLPTSLRFFMDVGVSENFYVGLETSTSLVKKTAKKRNRIANYYTLNPRFEKKWISVYSPVTLQQHTGFTWGLGVRAGIIVLGSQSLVSNVVSASRVTDIYAGIRVPIYK